MKLYYRHIFLGCFLLYGLASITFFSPVAINIDVVKAISWLIDALVIADVMSYMLTTRMQSKLTLSVKAMCIVLLYSIITAYYFHSQGIAYTLRVFFNSSFFFLYFFLKKHKFSAEALEKGLLYMTAIYMFCFMVALVLAPRIIFDYTGGGQTMDLNDSRGVARVKVLGTCFLYLSFFLMLNKAIVTKKLKHRAASGVLFIFILLNVSRQHIVFSFILGGWMLLANAKIYQKIIVVVGTVLIAYLAYTYVPLVQKLVALTEDQYAETGTQNVRILAYNYYFTSYNKTVWESILGNGIPHFDSRWGNSLTSLMNRTGYIPSDVGFAKIYLYFGWIGIGLYLAMLLIACLTKIPERYKYCKYYLLFVACTTISSHSFFTDMITMALALYIIDTVKTSKAKKLEKRKARSYAKASIAGQAMISMMGTDK
jgi:hypothetical protein